MSDGDFSDSADYSGHPDDLSPGVGGEDDDDGVYHDHDHDHDQEGSQTLDDENEYIPDQDIHAQQDEDGQRRRSHHLHEMHADDDSLDHSNSHSHQQSSQDLLAQQLAQTELGHSHSHMDDLQHDPTLQEQIHHAEPIEISAPQGASHEVNEAAQKLNHILHRTEDGEEHTHTSHDHHHRQSSTRRSSGLHGATAPSSNADYLRDMEVPPQATSSFSPSNKRASATSTKRESLQDSLRDRTHSASRRRRQSNQPAEEEKEEFAHHHHQDDDLQQELEDAPDDDYFDDLGDEEQEEEEVRTYEDVQRAKEEREHLIEVNRLRVRQIASILEREKLLKNSANKDGSNNNNSNNNNSSNNNNNNNNDMNTTPEQTRLEYVKTLEQLNSIWDELERKREDAEQRIDRLTIKLDKADAACLELSDSFKQFKREIARESRFSRNGQSIKLKRILAFEANEENLDRIVAKVRLRYIYLLKELNKLEESVMKKEKLAEGLHLIDFEQLKIENQTLNEKIEERNDELHKLRKKTTTTVQVLTHIKEKLWFVSEENTYYANELQQLIAKVGGLRDELTRNKIKRDQLRMDNGVLKQKQGFIGSDLLVNDFEMRKHDLGTMAGRVDELKARWRALDDLVQKATQMEKFQAKVMQQQLRGNQPFATLKFNQRR